MTELKTGIKGSAEDMVTEAVTAESMLSGGLPVYATPRMIAMMEHTAWSSVEPYMEEGKGTVGTHIDVKHLAASPLGARIRYESELTGVDGRRLIFSIRAWDDADLIGEGVHERFIISNEKFLRRTNEKLSR